MDFNFLDSALKELATNAPLLCIVAVFMVVVLIMYQSSIKAISRNYESTIQHMKDLHSETVKALRKLSAASHN